VSAAEVGAAAAKRVSSPRFILRMFMRFVMPLVMLGFGVYTVAHGGLQGLIALLPILGAHVVGFLVIFPLWVRFRKGRATSPEPASD